MRTSLCGSARAFAARLAALSLPLLLAACTTLGTFEQVDANRDNRVSPEEARQSEELSALFNSADDDQDGVLNHEEYDLVRDVILRSRESSGGGSPSSGQGSAGGHSH